MKKMYKLLLAVCFLYGTNAFSQQTFNTEFKTKTLQVYQNLDKNRVPHGILLDFGMEFTNLLAFNGTLTDSTYTTSQTMSNIYKTLLMCRVRQVTTGFITPEEYATRWYSQRQKGVIVLNAQYFKYNRFADNAYPNKLNYTNNQFSDKFVGAVWQNPYEEKQLFAMGPAISKYKGLQLQVKLPSNLFLSNYPSEVQSIEADFSDGLGYRTVTYNQLVNVSYTQANTYTWKYKITLTNGQTLFSHSKMQIEEGLNAIEWVKNEPGGNVTMTLSDYHKRKIFSTVAYQGAYGSATLYIRTVNGGPGFSRPLIVAEGFDPGVILNPEQEAGDNNIEDFIQGSSSNFSNSINLETQINTYDIIYVDWDNGVDFIQRNAYVLEEVIKWVNQNKSGSEQNVIIGQSMGGLVARYALRDIELNRNFNHDTKLYISHDAPHLGANTPYSVQYSARHLRNLYVSTPVPLLLGEIVLPIVSSFADGLIGIINNNTSWTIDGQPIQEIDYVTPLTNFSLADVPAARQMQYTWINRKYEMKNAIHQIWQQELSTMGYPVGYPSLNKPIRNIAIANGSECGALQTDNDNIMSYIKDAGRDTFLSNYTGILDSVYGTFLNNPLVVVASLFPGKSYWEINFQSKYMTTLNQSKTIYHGSLKYKKKVYWFIPVSITVTEEDPPQPSGVLPYDIYGGGNQRTNPNQLPIDGIVSNHFGFIPTASALDIGKGTTVINDIDYRKKYTGALPPVAPKNSPFDNFITHFDQFNPTNNNSEHISFNLRNGNWLATELDAVANNSQVFDCSFMCSNKEPNWVDFVCTSQVFTSPVIQSDATYVWGISEGYNLVTFSAATSLPNFTVTNKNIGSGYVTIDLYVTIPSCGTRNYTKRIWVGLPTIRQPLDCATNPLNDPSCTLTLCKSNEYLVNNLIRIEA
ncbi:hypothetical protein ACI6PS_16090, partial [Flavobacterium sp. PLA-1-15]|uniref:alpha/beta hydrolase n=1 Tax=Flavobacterium sp. PLA-1-15 TaxID=3380533 RepID=UPI003B77546B